jgi:radical SAM protein with 4Fe4S-binding SPASM domain
VLFLRLRGARAIESNLRGSRNDNPCLQQVNAPATVPRREETLLTVVGHETALTGGAQAAPVECAPPEWYYIDIGNICNLKCPFCRTGNGVTPTSEKGLMTLESFRIILSKIEAHATFVCLFNWGEPFLNKNLLPMISMLHERGIPVHLDSNLTLRDFDDDEAEAIVRSGLSSLFASIDGVTQESYEKYRVGGSLERALGNLRRLVAARNRLGSETPGLIWDFYLNRYNEHEVEAAREVAKDIGVDIWFKPLSCTDDFQATLTKQGADVFDMPPVASELHPLGKMLASVQLHPLLGAVCRQPFAAGVVNWNGDVYPCCVMGGEDFKLGNLIEQEFDEVWNGAPIRSCRTFLRNFGPVQGGDSVCENNCTAIPKHA